MNLSKVFDDIRGQMNPDSLIDSCSGEGCNVDMTDLPSNRIVIHVENEFECRGRRDEKRCDRLLFFINTEKKLVVVPIELKSGKADESDVVEKLENSLKFAEEVASGTRASTTEYRPALFHGRGIKWRNPKGSKRISVQFLGKKREVSIGKCGAKKNLANILSSYDYL